MKNPKKQKIEFKEGDPVSFVGIGSNIRKGRIESIINNQTSPINFKSESDNILTTFMKNGHYHGADKHRSLFHGHNITIKIKGEEIPTRTIEKSPKQKCLDHWLWKIINPYKNQAHYKFFLTSEDRIEEYNSCWACEECDEHCNSCKITWPNNTTCFNPGSLFLRWDNDRSSKNARAIYDCILLTWKE